ncbi:N-acetylmuramoyl-L-alanine amidase, partial [Bacillus cereus]|uniref:SH3 domain-containing protein n=1 Tax=Bacillus cereus TaxID=1396 RepID=UPI00355B68BB|nr:N-acetylmuramoyl-L-alanine amidase [Bacillus cereus]
PSTQPSNNGVGFVTITADVLRVRTGPGTKYDIVKKVYQGDRYQSWGIQNGWYNVGGDQCVSGEYVRFEG